MPTFMWSNLIGRFTDPTFRADVPDSLSLGPTCGQWSKGLAPAPRTPRTFLAWGVSHISGTSGFHRLACRVQSSGPAAAVAPVSAPSPTQRQFRPLHTSRAGALMAIGRIVQRFDDGTEFEVYIDDDLATPSQVATAVHELWQAAMAEDTED